MEEQSKQKSATEDISYDFYQNHVNEIQVLSKEFGDIVNQSSLKDYNFCVYYQHGRIGFLDLDAFAKAVDLKKEDIKVEEKEKKL